MWAVWAFIAPFFYPWAARGGRCLALGAFPVSQMVLELFLPFHPTRQKALHMRQVKFLFFPFQHACSKGHNCG